MQILTAYMKLTKAGIVCFALLTAGTGYLLSVDSFKQISSTVFLLFLTGLYLVCSGSFILNQIQEKELDGKMERTKGRPLPTGMINPFQASILSFGFLFLGFSLLLLLKPLTAGLAFLTVLLYNGFYTLIWKRKMNHGAVFGALPGALPPVIGYSLGSDNIFSGSSVYLFLILFLWQMPHFWSLAIRYKEDYRKGGVPVLPVAVGFEKTLFEMGLYMIAYLGVALISPLFLNAGLMYVIFLLPLIFKLAYEFFKYYQNPSKWLRFFLWINASILICFAVPVFDKWIFHLFYQI